MAALEVKVAALERGSTRPGVTGRTNPQLLDELFGVFADNPHALQVLRDIEQDRERERTEARRAE